MMTSPGKAVLGETPRDAACPQYTLYWSQSGGLVHWEEVCSVSRDGQRRKPAHGPPPSTPSVRRAWAEGTGRPQEAVSAPGSQSVSELGAPAWQTMPRAQMPPLKEEGGSLCRIRH